MVQKESDLTRTEFRRKINTAWPLNRKQIAVRIGSKGKVAETSGNAANPANRQTQVLAGERLAATAREAKDHLMSSRTARQQNKHRDLNTDVMITNEMLAVTNSSCEKEVQTVDVETSLSERGLPLKANVVFSLKNPSKKQLLDNFSS